MRESCSVEEHRHHHLIAPEVGAQREDGREDEVAGREAEAGAGCG